MRPQERPQDERESARKSVLPGEVEGQGSCCERDPRAHWENRERLTPEETASTALHGQQAGGGGTEEDIHAAARGQPMVPWPTGHLVPLWSRCLPRLLGDLVQLWPWERLAREL